MNDQRALYKPNLPDLMGLCSANYMLAIKLMADKEQVGEVREFVIGEQLYYQLHVKEVTKYTTLIAMTQYNKQAEITASNVEHDMLRSAIHPIMQVRLYHDAQMAEVISSQSICYIKPRYDYPNKTMHLPDEKRQINLFLKEWLQLCLSCGRINAEFDVS